MPGGSNAGGGGIGSGGQFNMGGQFGVTNPSGFGALVGASPMAFRRTFGNSQPGNSAGPNSGVGGTSASSEPTGQSGSAGLVIVEEFS